MKGWVLCYGPAWVITILIGLQGVEAAEEKAVAKLDDPIESEVNLQEKICSFKNVLPRKDLNSTFLAKVKIILHRLELVDEKSQLINTRSNIYVSWKHPKMSWNPSEYSGLTSTSCASEDIFVPDLTLINVENLEADDIIDISKHEVNVKVSSDGLNTWSRALSYKSHCYLDVLAFPYDTQLCKITFTSWIFNANEMDFTIQAEKADIFIPNGEWHLDIHQTQRQLKKYKCCPDPYVDLILTLKLKRKSASYVVNLIVPCAALSFLTLLTFIIPEESGEKMTFCMTLMLAMTVFQQLTAESMPSFAVPHLSIYYMAVLIMNAISLVLSVITLKLHTRRSPLPNWVEVIIINWIGSALMCHTQMAKKLRKFKDIIVEQTVNKDGSMSTLTEPEDLDYNQCNDGSDESDEDEEERQGKENNDNWILVCTILNRLFLVLMTLGFVCILLGFKIKMSMSKKEYED